MIQATTPAQAVASLADQGIIVSERTLRHRARQLGACRIIGKTMFLTPADIDRIIDASRPEPRECYTNEAEFGTMNLAWTDSATEALLARLTRPKPRKSQSVSRRKTGLPKNAAKMKS